MTTNKTILDACCGSRMFWFNKTNSNVLFADIRSESCQFKDVDRMREVHIKPDIIMDFTKMPFQHSTFKMVVFDPPHLNKLGSKSWMAKKYGVLGPSWQEDIKHGFAECMRVLQSGGTLIFKWNEAQITLGQVLKCIDYKPLFGHVTGKHGKTIWLCFIKDIQEDANF